MKTGKAIKSPLREDKHPSFFLYENGAGVVRYKDHGSGEEGDCFQFVQRLFNVDFSTALRIVHADFNLKRKKVYTAVLEAERARTATTKSPDVEPSEHKFGIITPNRSVEQPTQTIITIDTQAWTPYDIDYWGRFHVNLRTLTKFNVASCKSVHIQGYIKAWEYKNWDPLYAYRFINESTLYKHMGVAESILRTPSYKIYRPMAPKKEDKWRSNCNARNVFGLTELPSAGNYIIISKAAKDVMVLDSLGFNAIAPQSEGQTRGTVIPKDIMEDLVNRGWEFVVLFDDDKTGNAGAEYYKQVYGAGIMKLSAESGHKDIASYVSDCGPDNTLKKVWYMMQSATKSNLTLNDAQFKKYATL
jgi:hypothetical protein